MKKEDIKLHRGVGWRWQGFTVTFWNCWWGIHVSDDIWLLGPITVILPSLVGITHLHRE